MEHLNTLSILLAITLSILIMVTAWMLENIEGATLARKRAAQSKANNALLAEFEVKLARVNVENGGTS